MATAKSNISNVSAALKGRAKSAAITYVQIVRRLAEGDELKAQDLTKLEQAMATTGKTEADLDNDTGVMREYLEKSKARDQIAEAQAAASEAAKHVISDQELQDQIIALREKSQASRKRLTVAQGQVTRLRRLASEADALTLSHGHLLANIRVQGLEAAAARVPALDAQIEELKPNLRAARRRANELMLEAEEACELLHMRKDNENFLKPAVAATHLWEAANAEVNRMERELGTLQTTRRDAVAAGALADQLRAEFPHLFTGNEGA